MLNKRLYQSRWYFSCAIHDFRILFYMYCVRIKYSKLVWIKMLSPKLRGLLNEFFCLKGPRFKGPKVEGFSDFHFWLTQGPCSLCLGGFIKEAENHINTSIPLLQGDHLQVLLIILFWGDQNIMFYSSPHGFWSQHIGRFWYLYVLSSLASHGVAKRLFFQNVSSVIYSI